MKMNAVLAFLIFLLPYNIAQSQKPQFKPAKGIESKSITHKSILRTYDIYVPNDTVSALPLVLMLHGGGGNSKEAAYSTKWVEKAKKEGFIVVFPNGTRPDMDEPASFGKNGQSWNDGSTRSLSATENNIDDVGFIRLLIDALKSTYKIDNARIFATGFSNGASMTFRLGIECSDIFAAIAPVSGAVWLKNPVLKNPISVLYINGDKDPLNPYNGGLVTIGKRNFGVKKPINDLVMLWANMLSAEKKEDKILGDIHSITFLSPNAELRWLTIKDMGHHWPGGKQTLPKKLVGNPSNAINATDSIWDFFKNHGRK